MENVNVSGCIVTYNNIGTISDTLESLFNNTKNNNFKLFVVDNGSTDGTVEFIKTKYPQVELVETGKNLGFGKGHNEILNRLESKYHFIINPDVSIKDDAIGKMTDYFETHDDVGIVSPKICFPDGRLQILGKRKPNIFYLAASRMRKEGEPGRLLKKYAMLDCDLNKEMDIEVASGCFVGIRTDIFKRINGFDDRYFMYFEDYDLSRTVAKTARVRYFPEAVVYHEWGRESKRNTKLKMIHISSMFKYFLKWLFKK